MKKKKKKKKKKTTPLEFGYFSDDFYIYSN